MSADDLNKLHQQQAGNSVSNSESEEELEEEEEPEPEPECECCSATIRLSTISTDDGDVLVCSRCRDDDYQWSGPMDCYIPNENAVQCRDTDGDIEYITVEFGREEGWIRDPDDGMWYEDQDVYDDYVSGVLSSCANVLSEPYMDGEALAEMEERLAAKLYTDKELRMGVELEMEPWGHRTVSQRLVDSSTHYTEVTQMQLARRLTENNTMYVRNKFICKDDGSLRNGVEMVTVPLTLDEHLAEFGWRKYLARVQDCAISGKYTDRCGMHIHMNRAALTPYQAGKMLVLINSDVPEMSRMVQLIAQRDTNTYCEKNGERKNTNMKRCGRGARSMSHYDALSVTSNTLELRIFRGNLRAERVFKNVEFAHALAFYCRIASAAEVENWKYFAEWIISNRGIYRNLTAFLIEKDVEQFRKLRRTSSRLHPARPSYEVDIDA